MNKHTLNKVHLEEIQQHMELLWPFFSPGQTGTHPEKKQEKETNILSTSEIPRPIRESCNPPMTWKNRSLSTHPRAISTCQCSALGCDAQKVAVFLCGHSELVFTREGPENTVVDRWGWAEHQLQEIERKEVRTQESTLLSAKEERCQWARVARILSLGKGRKGTITDSPGSMLFWTQKMK